jgi:transposase
VVPQSRPMKRLLRKGRWPQTLTLLERKLITVQEVAEYLRVHPSSIYGLLHRHKLPGFKIGGAWRFNVEEIDRWRAEFENRRLREIVRQRVFLVRIRTMVRKRIDALLERYQVPLPAGSDIFGKGGQDCLAKLKLPAGAQEALRQDLALLETLCREVSDTENWLAKATRDDHRIRLLRTIPGLGDFFSAAVALEVDRVERFASPAELAAYAGLASATYSSGGHAFHGKPMPQSNKWLRSALVEAAWVAVRVDPYFCAHFAKHCEHKPPQSAIVATARRLLEIAWHVLKEDRCYQSRSSLSANRKELQA